MQVCKRKGQVCKRKDVLRFGAAALVLGVALFAVPAKEALAQAAGAGYPSYSAKFVCGPLAEDADVVRGLYASTVNLHNPQVKEITFTKQAVIALPERDAEKGTFGAMSAVRAEKLLPQQAMGVDCADIRALFGGAELPKHIEGFLVVTVPSASTDVLDVVGKYSARQLRGFKCHRHGDHDDDDDHKGKHKGHRKCKKEDSDDDDGGPGRLGKHRFWLGWGPDVETLDVEEVHPKFVVVPQGD